MPRHAALKDELLVQQAPDPASARSADGPVIIPIALRKLPGRPINLDNCFIAVDHLPFGVHLTAGVTNEQGTWLLTPRQMEEVALVVSSSHLDSFPVSLRIVMFDPDGYEFAATIARFDVLAKAEPGPRGVAPALELDFRRFCAGTTGWFQARFGSAESVPVLRLVDSEEELPAGARRKAHAPEDGEPRLGVIEQMMLAARAEWEAEENARFAREREQWQELEEQRRTIQNAEADDRLSRLLSEAEQRWRGAEADRVALAERVWRAAEDERIAAHDARWQAKMAQVFSVLSTHGIEIPAALLEVQGAVPEPGAVMPKATQRERPSFLSPAAWRLAAAFVLVASLAALISF
jgi:hypothetical protein